MLIKEKAHDNKQKPAMNPPIYTKYTIVLTVHKDYNIEKRKVISIFVPIFYNCKSLQLWYRI